MKKMNLSLDNLPQLSKVTKALGSDARLKIMELLNQCSMNIVELSQRLNMPMSTVSNNVSILEDADLIRVEKKNGIHGVMKLCSRKKDWVVIDLCQHQVNTLHSFFQKMPIGNYTDCQITPVCGLVSVRDNIGDQDDPTSFYATERVDAQLLWFQQGFVEYRFCVQPLIGKKLRCMEFSFEACSEAPNYRRDYPSDITVCVNDQEIGTWRCPGDFGGRPGRNSPDWWPLSSTQYGLLTRWKVDEKGSYLDDAPLSSVTLKDLDVGKKPYISLKIGIRSDAENQGGINLFGEHFGDYDQPIILRLDCEEKTYEEGNNKHE